jgi:hypothetical protein
MSLTLAMVGTVIDRPLLLVVVYGGGRFCTNTYAARGCSLQQKYQLSLPELLWLLAATASAQTRVTTGTGLHTSTGVTKLVRSSRKLTFEGATVRLIFFSDMEHAKNACHGF